MEDFAFVQIT